MEEKKISRGIQHANYELERSELSIHFTGQGSIILVDGTATIFGAPLKKNVRYNFFKCGIPVVCVLICRLHVEGIFTASIGILNSCVDNLHARLDLARTDATINGISKSHDTREEGPCGPRILVVGEQNTGKSSLCKYLANLATLDQKYGVALVDADVGQQSITCPGSISTVFMENFIPIDDGFNTMMPLTFFFGDKTVDSSSRKRYLDICSSTAQAITSASISKPRYSFGGLIVNTMGWTTGIGRGIIFELISVFNITHIIVCGSDKELNEELQNASIGRNIILLNYPKQPKMFHRGVSQLSESRNEQLVTYFKGTIRTPLSPYRGVAFIKDIQFINALNLQPISWQEIKPLSLAAISWADSLETVDEANIAGFIVLLEIGKKFFSFLSPAAGNLPKPFLLVSPTIKLPWSKVPPFSAS